VNRSPKIFVAVVVLAAALLASPIPVVAASAVRESPTGCRTVTYTPTTASRSQHGTLCESQQVSERTAVLLIHGGGGYSGSRSALAAWQTFYARRGIVTLSIDYTLTGEGATPTYPRPEQNAKAAVQYLRLHAEEFGTDRVVVQGHSAGARLGAILLTTPDDASFAGRELHRGVSDAIDGFIGFYGYYGGGQFRAAVYYGGETSWDANAVVNAARASGAALLFHGRADSVVPASRSMRFERALQRAGADADLVLVAGDHCFDGYGLSNLTASGAQSARQALQWLRRADTAAA
jgi:acetyl esterase/lipase